jgi:hypothetical protein
MAQIPSKSQVVEKASTQAVTAKVQLPSEIQAVESQRFQKAVVVKDLPQ